MNRISLAALAALAVVALLATPTLTHAQSPTHVDTEVVLYGADWCGACRSALAQFESLGVHPVYRNVDDAGAAADFAAYRRQHGIEGDGIPLIDVAGVSIEGWRRDDIEQAVFTRRVGTTMRVLGRLSSADLFLWKECTGECDALVRGLRARGARVTVHDLRRPADRRVLQTLAPGEGTDGDRLRVFVALRGVSDERAVVSAQVVAHALQAL